MTLTRRRMFSSLGFGTLAITSPRTEVLASAGSEAAALFTDGVGQPVAASGPHTLPPLPYPAEALEPHIDAQTMTIHHDRHHQAYVTNVNTALAKAPDLAKKPLEVNRRLKG